MALMITVSLMPLLEINSVYAMLDTPGTCSQNIYIDQITHFRIDGPGGKHYFPLQSKTSVEFQAPAFSKGYNITMILKIAPKNNNSNTQQGATWYSDLALGFGGGHCVNNVKHNSSVVIHRDNVYLGQAHSGLNEKVDFYTWILLFLKTH